VAEAIRMISDAGPEGQFVTGGTDLYPNMKRRQQTPKVVIGLAHLDELRTTAGQPAEGMVLGAGLTLTEVAEDRRIQDAYQHRGKPAARHALQLLQPELRVAEGRQLLHEEGRRHLLGGSFQPALLGGAVERFSPGDGGHRSEGEAGFECRRKTAAGGGAV
jgi:hypothetical protein